MKAAYVAGPSQVGIDCEKPRPTPGPGELLVRMKACGICGSDLEKVFGSYGQPSMRLGHEPAGIIVAVGQAADAKTDPSCDSAISQVSDTSSKGALHNNENGNNSNNDNDHDLYGTLQGPHANPNLQKLPRFSIGDRVFVHHHVPCYSCHLCRHGQETMCPKYYQTNLTPCGLAEEFIVPAWNVSHGGVLKLSGSTTFAQAAMIEPLACCVRAWDKFNHYPGDSISIFGTGPTGMMHVMLAVMHGFENIICLDLNEYRLGFARTMGATYTIRADDQGQNAKIRSKTRGRGVDVAIVATSSISALKGAVASTRKGGTVMMFGVPSKGAVMELDMTDLYSREITLSTSYAASDKDTAKALKMIESGKIQAGSLITHRYRLSESQRAFEHARSGSDAMKIVITDDLPDG